MATTAPIAAVATAGSEELPKIDIKPLLSRMWPTPKDRDNPVTAQEIADAIAHFFTNQVSDTQAASLLMCLHFTGLDRHADVMAKTAAVMRAAAPRIDLEQLRAVIARKGLAQGAYKGGMCDIVGTGGDAHNTFNISTTSSIIASSLLLIAKHGNRASTSKSGSADLLANMQPAPPAISAVAPSTVARVYEATNYAFLFAPVFHPGMRYVAPIRKQLPWRTLFNLVGPLANPIDAGPADSPRPFIEARVLGVARRELGPVFAESLRMAGADRALIVCGAEELDEVSCAGPTHVWRLRRDPGPAADVATDYFTVSPEDFGLPAHPLSAVAGNKEPAENAAILERILQGELADDDPILCFVLMNTAALFVASGICEADKSSMGPGDDGYVVTERGPGGERWKEGVRRARWAVKSGEAWKQWKAFVEVTNSL
ncbi:anthranilate phosphoribosyltransferase [Gaeumannomyces tritici R3-111a-1]|uniref:Anthranilate phosphoribosyltransferase n=1 Tax=Gaeumannomyces tritici (strain R3-111a-1) TaxID=644352 RepID=J3P964_GAET3|nr:anthranilate phosphoribosyltransferase [Gaeumannomyces tritici R3-111a-1]EJT73200.1 anthranilate phosphoribosyltransferase [Gaeumannomyces tritici R3-111a-1]